MAQAAGPKEISRAVPVVMVCRNNLPLTKLALRSVLAQDVPVEVLVVDNCSSDGTSQWLRTKNLMTIFPSRQWSLARCWNAALVALWRAGWDRALIINNDVELRADTVRILRGHGGEFVTCVSVDQRERMGVLGDRTLESLRANEREHPDFSCFMLSRSVTDRVGWFDERFWPAYCEDSDYHVRMYRAGVQAVCMDLPFLHHGAGTMKFAAPGERARIERGAQKNRERFRELYGCLPGTAEYGALFSAEGMNA